MRKALCAWRGVLVALVLSVAAGVMPMAAVAQGQGAAYGTRDVTACPQWTGATLTQALAEKFFLCFDEKLAGSYLYLDTGLTLQMGAGRKANPQMDTYDDLDRNSLVYPIRGSFTRYQCSKIFNIDAQHTNVGTNCNAIPQPQAQGICYRTTFGDWKCKMFDRVTDSSGVRSRVAPPGK